MARDHKKLRVFAIADQLVIDVYRATANMPPQERFGLQAQIRKAVVSSATNIVEGSARSTTRDYVHFLVISLGSATELAYFVDVSHRLGFMDRTHVEALAPPNRELIRSLQKMITSLTSGTQNP
jgi:four helix bundle protein